MNLNFEVPERDVILVDTKNIFLYRGGISAFFRPLLIAWISQWPDCTFILVGPYVRFPELSHLKNWRQWNVPWPFMLPRFIRHPVYDNVLFPQAVKVHKPILVFSPYHDVRIPRGIKSAIMVHDTCINDLLGIYPKSVRSYYLIMLKRNIRIASLVLTVSRTSRKKILSTYNISEGKVCILPNYIDTELTGSTISDENSTYTPSKRTSGMNIFYPGGADCRKNIKNLTKAVGILHAQGYDPHLWITSTKNEKWSYLISAMSSSLSSCFHFLGHLPTLEMRRQYQMCDTVVYPSLCEGFGRVVLEAMELGVPIACSSIDVLQEVGGDYPVYFDPYDPLAIAEAVITACNKGPQIPRKLEEYQPQAVIQRFIIEMEALLK